MAKRLELGSIDLIAEIRKLTVDNDDFDINQWCANDAYVLINAGKMILRELGGKLIREPGQI